MQRLNRHTRSNPITRGVSAVTVMTPLVVASMTFATGSIKDSSDAMPQEPHTVQEGVNDQGALPTPKGKTKVKPRISPLVHPGVSPFHYMYDVMTPWSMGYIPTSSRQSQPFSTPWGSWFWVTPQSPFGN